MNELHIDTNTEDPIFNYAGQRLTDLIHEVNPHIKGNTFVIKKTIFNIIWMDAYRGRTLQNMVSTYNKLLAFVNKHNLLKNNKNE